MRNSMLNHVVERFVAGESDDRSVYGTLPKSNIIETKESFRVEVAVPGYTRADLEISFEKQLLTLKGKKESNLEAGETYISREFSYQNFIRRYSVPRSVNIEGVKALVENGVLVLTLPKRDENIDRGPVNIEIK